jgi:hypothetical protein
VKRPVGKKLRGTFFEAPTEDISASLSDVSVACRKRRFVVSRPFRCCGNRRSDSEGWSGDAIAMSSDDGASGSNGRSKRGTAKQRLT